MAVVIPGKKSAKTIQLGVGETLTVKDSKGFPIFKIDEATGDIIHRGSIKRTSVRT